MDRLNRLARSLKTGGETRTMDQLRADVLLDLLQGTGNHAKRGPARGVVDLHVDLATLAELSDSPGDLGGYGPVIADIARQITIEQPHSEWRYTITHPTSGEVLANGTTRRRPTTAQTRHLHARYHTCVFPGCRMPAVACDLDHAIPWAQGGPTHTRYLAPNCRHDHTTRHRYGWTYRRLENGDHQWTSPLGHTYTTRSPPR